MTVFKIYVIIVIFMIEISATFNGFIIMTIIDKIKLYKVANITKKKYL